METPIKVQTPRARAEISYIWGPSHAACALQVLPRNKISSNRSNATESQLAASHPIDQPFSARNLFELNLHRVRLRRLLMPCPRPLHPLIGRHGRGVADQSDRLTPEFHKHRLGAIES